MLLGTVKTLLDLWGLSMKSYRAEYVHISGDVCKVASKVLVLMQQRLTL